VPSHYRYECYNCGYEAERYRNVKKCPQCGEALERVGELRICYHGTNRETADIIKQRGFKPLTYFGRHLEDALFMGGEYIFEVAFNAKDIPNNWQFRIKEWVEPSLIVSHYQLQKYLLTNNENLRARVLASNDGSADRRRKKEGS